MADPSPTRPPSPHPAHAYGRVTLWIVLALMAGSAIYAVWLAISNWSSISV